MSFTDIEDGRISMTDETRCNRCGKLSPLNAKFDDCAICGLIVLCFECHEFHVPERNDVVFWDDVIESLASLPSSSAPTQEAAWGPRPWECEFHQFIRRSDVDMIAFSFRDLTHYGEVNGHEILSRAQSTRDENLVDVSGQAKLCNFHNGWIDTHKELAEKIGLRRSLEVGE